MEKPLKINFIGAGNVAWHLAPELRNAGHEILDVYSRTLESATLLAARVGARPTNRKESLTPDAELYILALTDEGIMDFAREFEFPDALVIHTSGGIGMDVFKGHARRYGVLYPLQTFNKNRPVDFGSVPVLVEGSDPGTEDMIIQLSSRITRMVRRVDSEHRLQLHLAAVFACNFVNHMYDISARLVERDGMEFDLLKPLIRETAEKIMTEAPALLQTGPASRNDEKIIEKHMELLSFNSLLREVYRLLSESIRTRSV
jgi:predicted short-subunit dehydrogenase-like oxidoreductase (DUF2520 family)